MDAVKFVYTNMHTRISITAWTCTGISTVFGLWIDQITILYCYYKGPVWGAENAHPSGAHGTPLWRI